MKETSATKQIRVRTSVIEEVKSVKLLGMKIDNDQKMDKPLLGEGLTSQCTESKTNHDISQYIPKDKLKLIANSIWMSKMRHGLQLTNEVRLTEEDKYSKDKKATQLAKTRC